MSQKAQPSVCMGCGGWGWGFYNVDIHSRFSFEKVVGTNYLLKAMI